jgi:hypothetical protein
MRSKSGTTELRNYATTELRNYGLLTAEDAEARRGLRNFGTAGPRQTKTTTASPSGIASGPAFLVVLLKHELLRRLLFALEIVALGRTSRLLTASKRVTQFRSPLRASASSAVTIRRSVVPSFPR